MRTVEVCSWLLPWVTSHLTWGQEPEGQKRLVGEKHVNVDAGGVTRNEAARGDRRERLPGEGTPRTKAGTEPGMPWGRGMSKWNSSSPLSPHGTGSALHAARGKAVARGTDWVVVGEWKVVRP